MSITSMRFRNEGEFIVLQVSEYERDCYGAASKEKWRDAKTEDLLDIATVIRNMGMVDRPSMGTEK
jgi:hypothetical protein